LWLIQCIDMKAVIDQCAKFMQVKIKLCQKSAIHAYMAHV